MSISIHFGPFRVRFGPIRSASGESWGVGWGRGGVGERGFCKGKEYHQSMLILANLRLDLRESIHLSFGIPVCCPEGPPRVFGPFRAPSGVSWGVGLGSGVGRRGFCKGKEYY